MKEIDDIIDSFPASQATCLRTVRQRLRSLLPLATEDTTWGMPTFRIDGIVLISFLGFTHHNSLFPGPEVQDILGKALDGYTTTKGTIHFDTEKPPPASFLKAVVEARITAINRSFPKKSGEFKEFYPNGVVKAKGRYKNEAMHGAWEFYRRTGTIMRSGSFREGSQIGTWTTYTAEGDPYKTTTFA